MNSFKPLLDLLNKTRSEHHSVLPTGGGGLGMRRSGSLLPSSAGLLASSNAFFRHTTPIMGGHVNPELLDEPMNQVPKLENKIGGIPPLIPKAEEATTAKKGETPKPPITNAENIVVGESTPITPNINKAPRKIDFKSVEEETEEAIKEIDADLTASAKKKKTTEIKEKEIKTPEAKTPETKNDISPVDKIINDIKSHEHFAADAPDKMIQKLEDAVTLNPEYYSGERKPGGYLKNQYIALKPNGEFETFNELPVHKYAQDVAIQKSVGQGMKFGDIRKTKTGAYVLKVAVKKSNAKK